MAVVQVIVGGLQNGVGGGDSGGGDGDGGAFLLEWVDICDLLNN